MILLHPHDHSLQLYSQSQIEQKIKYYNFHFFCHILNTWNFDWFVSTGIYVIDPHKVAHLCMMKGKKESQSFIEILLS